MKQLCNVRQIHEAIEARKQKDGLGICKETICRFSQCRDKEKQQTLALDLLQEWERWGDLGIEEFLPEFARKQFDETWQKNKEFLNSVMGIDRRTIRGKNGVVIKK